MILHELESTNVYLTLPIFVELKKCFHKFFVGLALLVVLGHTAIAHHHHDEFVIAEDHHDHDDEHEHSIFSFGHLDEDFVPSKSQQNLPADLGYFIAELILGEMQNHFAISSKIDYQLRNEYPPPDNHYHTTSLRGPPFI